MIRLLKEKIRNDEFTNVIILTGAGMGVDSGLPDYRSPEGFWKSFPMAKEMGISFEDASRPSWFRIDAQEAWTFYGFRTNLYRNAKPHEGFNLLKDFVIDKNYFVITSNIDGMFQRAGFDKNKIYEMHGNLFRLQCSSVSGLFFERDCENLVINKEEYNGVVPLCVCGNPLRPNIQMFGDHQWKSDTYDKQKERFELFKKELEGETLIIEIGAGKAIPFVRNFSQNLNRMPGTFFVRINPFEFEGPANLCLSKTGLEGLRDIFN